MEQSVAAVPSLPPTSSSDCVSHADGIPAGPLGTHCPACSQVCSMSCDALCGTSRSATPLSPLGLLFEDVPGWRVPVAASSFGSLGAWLRFIPPGVAWPSDGWPSPSPFPTAAGPGRGRAAVPRRWWRLGRGQAWLWQTVCLPGSHNPYRAGCCSAWFPPAGNGLAKPGRNKAPVSTLNEAASSAAPPCQAEGAGRKVCRRLRKWPVCFHWAGSCAVKEPVSVCWMQSVFHSVDQPMRCLPLFTQCLLVLFSSVDEASTRRLVWLHAPVLLPPDHLLDGGVPARGRGVPSTLPVTRTALPHVNELCAVQMQMFVAILVSCRADLVYLSFPVHRLKFS
ncbi:uncharacterized protein LOC123034878 [Varanus komodoensis]|uniref:uncharacterized protein LOC123034878 n=1 Tax=Varanus komodoensis TaxID=61221 RepID=UPI001CF76C0A|nr:uncharacterized protein LOC123034878 [Varanus komodoensis]